jgi:hypothetical protein
MPNNNAANSHMSIPCIDVHKLTPYSSPYLGRHHRQTFAGKILVGLQIHLQALIHYLYHTCYNELEVEGRSKPGKLHQLA